MSNKKKPAQDLIETRITLSVPCRFDTGPLMGRLLKGLRDEKRIWATQCGCCGRTMLPPAKVCAICNLEAEEWVELADEGYLINFDLIVIPTINPLTGKMRKVPYTVGRIMLDGGDAVIWHFLDETDPDKLAYGKRCKAVWEKDRKGYVLDIKHFKVLNKWQPGIEPEK